MRVASGLTRSMAAAIIVVALAGAPVSQPAHATATCTPTQVTFSFGGVNDAPSINADGTLIAFVSTHNLTGENADLGAEVFLYNTVSGTLTQITKTPSGFHSGGPSISADGTRIAFFSNGDLTGGNPDGNRELFLYDATAVPAIRQITSTVGNSNPSPVISGDGSTIVFTDIRNMTTGADNPRGRIEIYRVDVTTTTITQVTVTTDPGGFGATFPAVNADGTRIAFLSLDNLTGQNSNFRQQIVLWVGGPFVQITNGPPGASGSTLKGPPSMSADGSRIAFLTDDNLVGGSNGFDLYLWTNGSTFRLTSVPPGFLPDPQHIPSINAEGSRIAFASRQDLTGNNADRNIELFLFDIGDASLTQVTTSTGGFNKAPSINAGGTRTAFVSTRNYVGQNADLNQEIYLTTCSAPPAVPQTVALAHGHHGKLDDPVSTAGGELYDTATDLSLGGSLPLSFQRYYASGLGTNGVLGRNWMHNFNIRVNRTSGAATVAYAMGKTISFLQSGSNWVLGSVDQDGFQLINDGAGLKLMDPSSELVFTFDATGNLNVIEDRNGNAHTLTYASGQLSQVADGLGRTLNFAYTGGKLVQVADHTGRSVTFAYTGDLLTGFTDLRAQTTTYTYTTPGATQGLMTKRTRPLGNTPFTQAFDASARVVTQTDGAGNATSLAFDTPVAATTTRTDPLSHTTQHVHAAGLHLKRRVDEAGHATVFTYDTHNRRATVTDRLAAKTSFTYHAPSGKTASITHPDGAKFTYTYTMQTAGGFTFYDLTSILYPDATTQSFTRDAKGKLLSHTDRAGKTSNFTYNSRGQVLTAANPKGGVTTNAYSADGTLASSQDPALNVTSFLYDAQKRRTRVNRPDGTFRLFAYDNGDNVVTGTDERGGVTTFTYDANGNLSSSTDPLGKTTTYAYDALDRVISVTDPLAGVTHWTYNEIGEVDSIADPANNTVSFDYDARSRMTQARDAAAKVWTRSYDNEGRMTASTSPLAKTFGSAYDSRGRATSIVSPGLATNILTYDNMSRLTTAQDALGRTTAYGYDAEDRLASITLSGVSATFTRDALGEITAITDPNAKVWGFGRDVQGRVTSMTDPLGNVETFAYDNRQRISQVTLPGGLGNLAITYDDAGNPTRKLYSDGTDIVYAYDAANRMTTANGLAVAFDGNGRVITSNGIGVAYDASGRITTVTLAPGKTLTYVHDARDLLLSITDWIGGVTAFTYDDAGRRLSISRPNGVTTTYAYNDDNRVVGITETGAGTLASLVLARDARGQVVSATRNAPLTPAPVAGTTTFTYDNASQLAGATYDALGRLLGDGTRTYTWDLDSRLRSYVEGALTSSFTYDGLGQVRTRTEGGTTKEFVWNYALDLPAMSVVKQAGIDERYYVHTSDGTLLYSVEANNNSRRFYHFDELGSTLFLSDAVGVIVKSYAYEPDGRMMASAAAVENPFTWLGKFGVMREPATDLYYMRQRYYDSRTQRFISREPLLMRLEPQAINPYQYAAGNPLFYIDVDGEAPTDADQAVKGSLKKIDDTAEVTGWATFVTEQGAEYLANRIKQSSWVTRIKAAAGGFKQGKVGYLNKSQIERFLKENAKAVKNLGRIAEVAKAANVLGTLAQIRNMGRRMQLNVWAINNDVERTQNANVQALLRLSAEIERLRKLGLITEWQAHEKQLELEAAYNEMLWGADANAIFGILTEAASGLKNMVGALTPEPVQWVLKKVGWLDE